ncbi:glycoside hydrolase family 3 N-terminal domain-containing protein [Bacteroides fragilis]|uniref:glycoside hydrolase family 3 N-terminal domain-containing protein n=1 Tax=Bacteroides fragilis TaxID=817 RepID=UPI00202EEB68|nr:glycoside hydrolase family 3 N-terminal domain-containing protein [Bacteroides fragilis]
MKQMRLYYLLSFLSFFLCIPVVRAQQHAKVNWEKQAQELISQMTIEEKISQMMNDAGGIERLRILPYNWWNEALHGVARNGKATLFPQPINMASTFDPELVYQVASAISDEARAKFNVAQRMKVYEQYAGLTFWSPNVNIFRDPRWGRGMETYGEDPYLAGQMGLAFVRGLQGDDPNHLKAAACAKHYAVHSGPEASRHQFDAKVSDKDLFETYLPAFEILVKEGQVEAVMGAYNRVNGVSASAHPRLLNEILRDQWGFKGHVVSDCGAVSDIFWGHKSVKSEAEAAAVAIKSGLNLECGSSFRTLKEALEQGLVTEKDIDKALMPLMVTRLKLGLFDDPSRSPYGAMPDSVVCCSKHQQLALKAAEHSIVMLSNKDHVLPLKKEVKTLYVTGPLATEANVLLGNYYSIPANLSTYLEAISDKASIGTRLQFIPGILATTPNVNPIDWATGASRTSDITIVFLGESNCTEGEEGEAIASSTKGDRLTLSLAEHQMDYLRRLRKGNKNKIITVVSCGGPFDVREMCELSDAVLWVGYPGQEGGSALANVLFGDVSPSGHLPVTFPESEKVLPDFADYSMKGRTYRYQKEGIAFPFGYGLTYSQVAYDNLLVDQLKDMGKKEVSVSVLLTNTGSYEVEEVPQVYISTPRAGVDMPLNTLVAFQRVPLKAKESKKVTFTLSPEQLKMVNDKGKKELLKGSYQLTVSSAAPSGRDEALHIQKQQVSFVVK